jgi:hypothetical protein
MERELTIREATEVLENWAASSEHLYGTRNRVVRQAWEAGLGKSRIAQLTGLSRGTVERILREPRP